MGKQQNMELSVIRVQRRENDGGNRMKTGQKAKILFLDDSPERRKIFKKHNPASDLVETAAGAIAALEQRAYDTVSLDCKLGNDLGEGRRPAETGMDVVRWIVKHGPEIRQVVVHSSNAEAADRMVQALRKKDYHSFRRPFGFRGWRIE
jgi:CheY-like chemotaxis protein